MKYRTWTTKELQYLKQNYRSMTAEELADKLKRSKYSVQSRAKRIGLKKRNELYRVRKRNGEIVAIGTPEELAKRLNVQTKTIHKYSTPGHIKRDYSVVVEKIGLDV